MSDLRGKIVLIDFWTYACVNCMHVVPDLKFLEEKYAGKPFTVVGVHSAKFTAEKGTDIPPDDIEDGDRHARTPLRDALRIRV